jgi:cytochrome c556
LKTPAIERRNEMKTLWQLLGLLMVLTAAGAIWAADVLDAAMDSPREVVAARKGLMSAIGGNMRDMVEKLQSGRTAAVTFNAGTISAIAAVLPPLYRQAHADAYPFQGSKAYYRPGPPAEFETAAANMKSAAEALGVAAVKADKSEVEAALEPLKSSCGACHSAFRGQY